jgi:hypothetical protein
MSEIQGSKGSYCLFNGHPRPLVENVFERSDSAFFPIQYFGVL